MTRRLSAEALGIEADKRPAAGIVHLGLGAFFRAHGVSYIHQVQQQAGNRWGIIGVSLMRPTQRDLLVPQDFIYTALEQGPDGPRYRHYDDVVNVLVAPEDPAAVIAAMADPAIKIVTMTVTEKGYCLDPSSGQLNKAHPDIAHDMANLASPRSAIGFLVAALSKRKTNGHRPFSVLSCDNLPSNGVLVRDAVIAFAAEISPDLAAWIETHGRFPATMIDRIVPATTQGDVDLVREQTGYTDLSPVIHEPFSQWVIEDNFVDGERPPLEHAGAQFVRCVAPYEMMKLRCLNGSHSALAYLGFLSGHRTIYEAISDPVLAAYTRRMWHDEIIPTLPPLDAVDYAAYCDALLTRFANPAIEHKTAQIAMDGSQKLPQRLLATLTANKEAGRPFQLVLIAIAAWMAFVSRADDQGNIIPVADALADEIRAQISGTDGSADAVVGRLLAMEAVFPSAIANSTAIRTALTEIYTQFARLGVRDGLQQILEDHDLTDRAG